MITSAQWEATAKAMGEAIVRSLNQGCMESPQERDPNYPLICHACDGLQFVGKYKDEVCPECLGTGNLPD